MAKLNFPPLGLSLQPSADPTGNNQESVRLVYHDPATGTIYETGDFYQIHAGQKIRGVSVPTSGAAAAVFEMDEASKIIRV